ncbi:MAG: fibronectin type III domain-containing protein, partial [Bacteroidales bacterium]|nr:fibronectin type III domain-containing protein [Bacteroidales bacterium]
VMTVQGQNCITCLKPDGLTASEITQNSAVLTWNATDNATYYIVELLSGNVPSITFTVQVPKLILKDLLPNTKYYWKVKKYCYIPGTGNPTESDYSDISYFTTLTELIECNTPIEFASVDITINSATIKWSAVKNACYYRIAYYSANSPNNVIITKTQDTKFVISNLAANTQYEWKIQTLCCNSAGAISQESAYSEIQKFITLNNEIECSAPKELIALEITTNSVFLKWAAVPNACYYRIAYSPYNATDKLIYLTTKDPNITLKELIPNTKYYWKVQSLCCASGSNDVKESPYSYMQYFVTLPETTLECTVATALKTNEITTVSAILNWTAVKNACNYRISYYPSNDPNSLKIVTTQDIKFVINGLMPATEYVWKIQTLCCNNGTITQESAYSELQKFTTLKAAEECLATTEFNVSEITTTSVLIRWKAAQGACYYNVVYFPIDKPDNILNKYTQDIKIAITGLNPNTKYSFKIQSRCCNTSQNIFVDSETGYFVTLAENQLLCKTPVEFVATEITQNSVLLKWNKVENACYYMVYYYPVKSMMPAYITVKATSNMINLANLISNSEYEWRVRTICCDAATGTNYESEISEAKYFTTLPSENKCLAPVELFAKEITKNSVILNWNSVENACYYYVYYYPVNNPNTYYKYIKVNENSVTINDLIPNTQYEWKIKTICCSNDQNLYTESPFSLPSVFTTLSDETLICNPPKELKSNEITSTSAVLSWSAVEKALVYIVEYKIAGTAAYTSLKTQDTRVIIKDLKPAVKYEWRVKVYCSTSVDNIYSETAWFITLPENPAVCIPPVDYKNFDITTHSAGLAWSPVPNACYYLLVYYPANGASTNAKYIKTKDTRIIINDLLCATGYEWKVKSICCDIITNVYTEGDFGKVQMFNTMSCEQPVCKTPVEFASGEITVNSALIKWNPVENACYYTVYYKPADGNTDQILIIQSKEPKIVLTNLKPDTKYEWKVKTICCSSAGTAFESEFSRLQYFQTLNEVVNNCFPPKEVKTAEINFNSAVLFWNPVDKAAYYIIAIWTENGQPRYITAKENKYLLQGLTPQTKYFWKVKTVCLTTSNSQPLYSEYSQTAEFITKAVVESTCKAPKELVTSEIKVHKALLLWEPVENARFYLILVKAKNKYEIKYYISKENKYMLEGLKAETEYTWKVKAICNLKEKYSFTYSPFSENQMFKTLADEVVNNKCVAPELISKVETGKTSAILEWKVVEGAKAYIVIYKEAESKTDKYELAETNTIALNDLMPGTKYQWKVASMCDYNANGMALSKFSELAYFETKAKGSKKAENATDNSLNYNIYPNPTTGVINFSISATSKAVDIYIYNISGSLIYQQNITSSSSIDLSSYNKGIYFIKVMSDKNVKTDKIIIQ